MTAPFTLSAILTGAAVLLNLIVREAQGRPLLRREPEPFRPAEPALLVAGAFGAFAAQSLCALLVAHDKLLGTPWSWVGLGVGVALGVGLYAAVVRWVTRTGASARRSVGDGLLVAWAALPVVYGAFLLIQLVTGVEDVQPQVRYMEQGKPGWIELALFAVLVAPVVEEVAFRGLLYPALRRRWGAWGAVVGTSVLFGAVHLQANVIMPLAIFGVFLAYLIETTGSLLACVAAHAAFNALTVAQVIWG